MTAALEKVLDKKLEPLVKMLGRQEALLLEQKYGGPRISDIVGGIGWILGLVGVASFFWCRKR
jgi:nickel transport protein